MISGPAQTALWKQWKQGRKRFAKLQQRGIGGELAAQTAGSPHGPWRLANSPALAIALPKAYLDSLGIFPGWLICAGSSRRTTGYGTRTHVGVTGTAGRPLTYANAYLPTIPATIPGDTLTWLTAWHRWALAFFSSRSDIECVNNLD